MKKRFLLALAALLTSFQWLVAIPARPGRLTLVQPDGTKIVVTLHGDEFGHWATDLSGRLLRQDADGFYRVDTETDLPSLQRRASSLYLPTGLEPVARPSVQSGFSLTISSMMSAAFFAPSS